MFDLVHVLESVVNSLYNGFVWLLTRLGALGHLVAHPALIPAYLKNDWTSSLLLGILLVGGGWAWSSMMREED